MTSSRGAVDRTRGFASPAGSRLRCRNDECDVSSPPSIACNQLHAWWVLETHAKPSGARIHSRLGSGGRFSDGPIYVHTTPAFSTVGYATACTLCLKSDSAGSFGM